MERGCGHCTHLPCAGLGALVEGKRSMPRCKVEVPRRLDCGHHAQVGRCRLNR